MPYISRPCARAILPVGFAPLLTPPPRKLACLSSTLVKATAAKPGTYAIQGTFNFGVCRIDTCHSKRQPITITVTAS